MYTPGVCQKPRSAPQKQPMPKMAVSTPSGKGGSSGVPSTKCVSGTWNGRVSRPGRASAGSGIAVLSRNRKLIPSRVVSASRMELDYFAPDLTGERFHETINELRRETWLAKSELGYFVLDREAGSFFLRTKSATFPGLRIAEMFDVEEGPLLEQMRRNILHINGDGHRRLRNLVNPAFTPRAADRWRPAMREFLERLWAPLADARGCEFVADFAKPYPSLTIATVMGAPLEDAPKLHEWSNLIQRQFDPPSLMNERDAIERACAEFYEWAGALIERRRDDPGDDLISTLIAASHEGDRLDDAGVHEPRPERARGRGRHDAVAARPRAARVRRAPGPVGAARGAAGAGARRRSRSCSATSRSRRSPRACSTRRWSTAA